MHKFVFAFCLVGAAILAAPAMLQAQPAAQPAAQRPRDFDSHEVSAERKITFRIHAPSAQEVRLVGGDIPDLGRGKTLESGDGGVWQTTVGPVPAGAYRYHFEIEGVSILDPRNPATSESNTNTWSLVTVPGSDLFDTREVPHGAVAAVTYYSKSLKKFRRAHVYTPPGYEAGNNKYPVFYLLHGASDSDLSWSTVGRAGFILDNLIAVGKAKPMIVVMPAGHTSANFTRPAPGERRPAEFETDFSSDLKPYIETAYRTLTGRQNCAIAGLSMGGGQTLNIAFSHLDEFGYVGVFSSGVFGIVGFPGREANTQWEDEHKKTLDDAALKKDLKLVWFGCGKQDFLLSTSNATIEMLRRHDIKVESKSSEGGHTWLNWRDYLVEFAPKLFQDVK